MSEEKEDDVKTMLDEIENDSEPIQLEEQIEKTENKTENEENKTENEENEPHVESDADKTRDENVESNEVPVETTQIPDYKFIQVPVQLSGAWNEFKEDRNNFFKGCKWAPDGSCILTNSNDGYLRLWNLPDVFYNMNNETNWSNIPEMTSVLKMREGELIYDYCWYPMMSSLDNATCCFASTSRNSPVHLFDAYTGLIRCSYRPYNHVDEIEAAHCVCFSHDGLKLYCGFNKVIRVFDVNTPGRNFTEAKAKTQGQSGIISCIAINPGLKDVYAAGSYLKTIALYSEPDGNLICLLQGQRGGVTQIEFSPDGNKLYSGGRMDNEILCWDLRNPGTVLFTMEREVTTNQRMYFCSDKSGVYVLSGHNNGSVSIWDTSQLTNETDVLTPKLTFQAHDDCVNGISLHPSLSLLVTASGQRKFAEPLHSDESDCSSDETFTEKYISYDNSLRLWWLY